METLLYWHGSAGIADAVTVSDMEAWLVDDELDDGELDVEVCAAGEVVVFAVAVAVEVGVGLDEAGSPADVEVAAARAGSVDGWVHPAMTTKTTARADRKSTRLNSS